VRHDERAFNKHFLDRLTIQQLRPTQRTRQLYYLHTAIITRTDCEWLAAARKTNDRLHKRARFFHDYFQTVTVTFREFWD